MRDGSSHVRRCSSPADPRWSALSLLNVYRIRRSLQNDWCLGVLATLPPHDGGLAQFRCRRGLPRVIPTSPVAAAPSTSRMTFPPPLAGPRGYDRLQLGGSTKVAIKSGKKEFQVQEGCGHDGVVHVALRCDDGAHGREGVVGAVESNFEMVEAEGCGDYDADVRCGQWCFALGGVFGGEVDVRKPDRKGHHGVQLPFAWHLQHPDHSYGDAEDYKFD